MQLIILNYAWG